MKQKDHLIRMILCKNEADGCAEGRLWIFSNRSFLVGRGAFMRLKIRAGAKR